jgi:hypothetical protein
MFLTRVPNQAFQIIYTKQRWIHPHLIQSTAEFQELPRL